MDLTKSAGPPRAFLLRCAVIARRALVRRSPPSGEGGCDEAIHRASFRDGASAPDPEPRDSGFDALHRPGMTAVANAYRASYLMCYKDRMFPDRQTIASRVVLDDRSRLPWRFFGRLTTAALAA